MRTSQWPASRLTYRGASSPASPRGTRRGPPYTGNPLPDRPRAGVSLPAEAVEFSVLHAAEKCVPLIRCESEHRTLDVPAVPDANLVVGQACHFDAVAVGEAQRAFDPVRICTRPFGRIFQGRLSHRL